MAVVRRQKGDKTKETKKGNLVITRANGTVVKINKNKGIITRTKPNGKVVTQKLTSVPTAPIRETGSAYGSRSKWNIETMTKRSSSSTTRAQDRNR
jgi:hypothetical protein